MNRPNGEQSGFGSSLVFSTQRGTLKHPYDYYVAFFFPPPNFGGFCSEKWGGFTQPPLRDSIFERVLGMQVGICWMIFQWIWASAPGAYLTPGAQSHPGRFTAGSAAACLLPWGL